MVVLKDKKQEYSRRGYDVDMLSLSGIGGYHRLKQSAVFKYFEIFSYLKKLNS